jgi:hypothetical protein
MKLLILTTACIAIALIIFAYTKNKNKQVSETTPGGRYTVIITEDEIACEHPKRKRESIRWDQINEIRLVTTDEGPFNPDMWYLFIGESGGCSVPSEAEGFDRLWDEFEKRFKGIDYQAMIDAGTDNAEKTIWKK